MKLTHCCLADLTGCEVEAGEILGCREACDFQMIGDRAHLTFGQFRLGSCDRIGMAASNASAPCSIKLPTACAMPYILRLRSMSARS